jgi:hypothetical protein
VWRRRLLGRGWLCAHHLSQRQVRLMCGRLPGELRLVRG